MFWPIIRPYSGFHQAAGHKSTGPSVLVLFNRLHLTGPCHLAMTRTFKHSWTVDTFKSKCWQIFTWLSYHVLHKCKCPVECVLLRTRAINHADFDRAVTVSVDLQYFYDSCNYLFFNNNCLAMSISLQANFFFFLIQRPFYDLQKQGRLCPCVAL